jgi:pimeloyl-ACP methyl ester carboxylesterase
MRATCDREVRLADGRILQAQTTGAADGHAVLLLHRALGSRLVHGPLSAAAAGVGIRLLSNDRPGYGGSTPQPGRTVADTAADVVAIADQLGVDRLAVWGESGGCPFALACAALLPDRVAAAAVVSPLAPFQAPGLDWFAGMADDVAQMHRLAVAGRDALQQAMPQLAEVLTSTDLDRFIEVSRPALPPRPGDPCDRGRRSPACQPARGCCPRGGGWDRGRPRVGRTLGCPVGERPRAGQSVVRRAGQRHPDRTRPLACHRHPRCRAAPIPRGRAPVAHLRARTRGPRLARPAAAPRRLI